jgi:hypothetical protein
MKNIEDFYVVGAIGIVLLGWSKKEYGSESSERTENGDQLNENN